MPGVPSAQELSALPAAELATRLAEAYRLIAELTAQVGRLSARVEDLERQARRDSSTSSRPPSSDSPYQKKGADRSLRERGKRRPGKQPGEPGMTMNLVDDPDERLEFPPAACCGCGAGLAGEPVLAQRRHQVTDIAPALMGVGRGGMRCRVLIDRCSDELAPPASAAGGIISFLPSRMPRPLAWPDKALCS